MPASGKSAFNFSQFKQWFKPLANPIQHTAEHCVMPSSAASPAHHPWWQMSSCLPRHAGLPRDLGIYQVGEITWPSHVTGVPTPQFSSNQALNSYAIFQGVGKSHFTKNQIYTLNTKYWLYFLCSSRFMPFFRIDGVPQTMALHIWRT